MEEHVMDVSWMTHGKDKLGRNGSVNPGVPPKNGDTTPASLPLESTTPSKVNGKTSSPVPSPSSSPAPPAATQNANAKTIPQPRAAGLVRSTSNEKKENGTPSPQRRGSWFSSVASKFSTSPANNQPATAATSQGQTDGADDIAPLPKITPSKNAVLPHASRQTGDAPYVPAPPKSTQPGFLGVFRRLSSSNGPTLPTSKTAHGLVERKVLNVDKNRERCRIDELKQSKLRRVAFCVDVEIAPMPRYADEDANNKKPANDKAQKRKMEKSEAEALKNPKTVEIQKEEEGVVKATGEQVTKEPEKEGNATAAEQPKGASPPPPEEPKCEKETTRKKEKKKKSEAERKAKKEQKRRDALEKGAIPMELHFDSDSSDDTSPTRIPRTQSLPTSNPGRIYRRCCQLRETDILTKVTNQLPKSTESCPEGVVEKLDLTGYMMSLQDLVTLGDFLAVVPIKEVVLENCGLSDEGMRVILAGLLAARKPHSRPRKPTVAASDPIAQGGVVERLVLKNNKIGIEGWRHICLFINLCRSVKCLDLSSLPFPAPPPEPVKPPGHHIAPHLHLHHQQTPAPHDVSILLAKSLGERLAGADLELLNIGANSMSTNQLGAIIDGMIKSGVSRVGLSHNNLDAQGVQHIARYLRHAKCEGVDLGGNDLRDHLEVIGDAIEEHSTLWALSLAGCNLGPASLCKLAPKLVKLPNFKFLDLSHNHDLFESEPSAVGLLRRCLPKMKNLKRVHLADVSLSSEQAIALAEVLPEITQLAHINLLENTSLVSLADARTEESREEACALYASLLAAARVSNTLVKIDIDNPSAESGEIVKALANQVVAHCLQNLHSVPDIRDAGKKIDNYPDVLRHLVGAEDDYPVIELSHVGEAAPDDDYIVGGTGVAKALACVLKNRGDDSKRQSGEFFKEIESGATTPRRSLPSGKAKDMSKHLLATARKIRARLGPALAKAKASSSVDMNNCNRLEFLDNTILEIIKRFEDEFPETRQDTSYGPPVSESSSSLVSGATTSGPSIETDPVFSSDQEDLETDLRSPSRSRSNSIMSHTSRALADEEGRTLRAGHKFRIGFLKPEHYDLISGNEDIRKDPTYERMVAGMLDELTDEDPELRKKIQEEGPIKAFEEGKPDILRKIRDKDPAVWDRFIESQEKTRANLKGDATKPQQPVVVDEEAIAD